MLMNPLFQFSSNQLGTLSLILFLDKPKFVSREKIVMWKIETPNFEVRKTPFKLLEDRYSTVRFLRLINDFGIFLYSLFLDKYSISKEYDEIDRYKYTKVKEALNWKGSQHNIVLQKILRKNLALMVFVWWLHLRNKIL